MIPQLRDSRNQAPRRKFRGKKAYFRRVLREADTFEIDPTAETWWDCWHYHADWPGWGNLRWSYRYQHLCALAVVYRKVVEASSRFATPFQAWVYLSGRDAGEDATYLHTPNANGTPFPLELSGVTWGPSRLLPVFEALLPGLSVRVGEWRGFDEYAEPPRVVSSFFVYCEEVGVPLELAGPEHEEGQA